MVGGCIDGTDRKWSEIAAVAHFIAADDGPFGKTCREPGFVRNLFFQSVFCGMGFSGHNLVAGCLPLRCFAFGVLALKQHFSGVVTSDGGLILFGGEKAVRHWLHSIILIMDGQFF
ncbi:hypothetical protein SDC9_136037 [bioreactor metagenome]|uniref:Uncharacterized protein n=1 Tax=bioreactor metagenome TaxID=1076179 RepID=A0A645DJD4_9ZZZZ